MTKIVVSLDKLQEGTIAAISYHIHQTNTNSDVLDLLRNRMLSKFLAAVAYGSQDAVKRGHSGSEPCERRLLTNSFTLI